MTTPATATSSNTAPTSGCQSRSKYWEEGKDIWIRARTNALAHRLAAESLERWNFWLRVFEALFIVIPIVAVALMLNYVTSMNSKELLELPFELTYTNLALASIFANGLVLFAGLLSKELKLGERASQHRTLLSNYSTIAQKIRRLDTLGVDNEEAQYLCRYLQETFELCKSSSSVEPNDKMFRRAQKILPTLKPLPFDIPDS